jgi:hypothetical protein
MKTALIIFVLFALLAGAVWVGHYGWESAGDVVMPAWGWLMMGLGIFFTLLVGGGLMALVFYSSRAGFDEPPEVVQEKEHRAAKWRKMIPRRKNGARPSNPATEAGACAGSSRCSPLEHGGRLSAVPATRRPSNEYI